MLLNLEKITKDFGVQRVLDIESFTVYTGDKVGVVGKNGTGKSTLLNIIARKTLPDSGKVYTSVKTVYLEQFSNANSQISGGENQKEQIRALKGQKNLLILADEPTSNLDSLGQKWLVEELGGVETFLVVSHDRTLLDTLATKIVEIENGKLVEYTGNYSDYERAKENARENMEAEHREYEKKKTQLELAVAKKERQVASTQQSFRRKTQKNESEARLWRLSQSNKEKQIQQEQSVLRRRLEGLVEVSSQKKERKITIDFSKTNPPENKRLIAGESYSYSYGDKVIFENTNFYLGRGERLALCGVNGSGKTTLINSILGGDPSIVHAPKLKIGYLAQNFSQLDLEKTVLENVISTSVQNSTTNFNILAALLFTQGNLEKKGKMLSGGERMRLGLAKLVLSACNALVLDEPTNFLDIDSLTALEDTLLSYPGSILFVSHDPTFVEKIATRKLMISDKKLVEPVVKREKVRVNKLILELRRDEIIAQLGNIEGSEKENLEKEYENILGELKKI